MIQPYDRSLPLNKQKKQRKCQIKNENVGDKRCFNVYMSCLNVDTCIHLEVGEGDGGTVTAVGSSVELVAGTGAVVLAEVTSAVGAGVTETSAPAGMSSPKTSRYISTC